MDMVRRKVAGEISCLPREIMFRILVLLPFESILACRLASKELKDLINHPDFFNLYHHKPLSLYTSRNTLYCILATHGNKFDDSKPLLECRVPITESKLSSVNTSHFMASNGMTCVEDQNGDFVLYNMFSGSSYIVKNPYVGNWPMAWFNGFGYDAYVRDYKIFVTLGSTHSVAPYWVYSVKNNAWESFTGFPSHPYDYTLLRNLPHSLPHNPRDQPNRRACFLNGALHWIIRVKSIALQPVIAAYDLHARGFYEIAFPHEITSNGSHSDGLTELGGKLGYWRNLGSLFQVWVMKEYRVNESWMSLLSINPARISPDTFCKHLIEPVMMCAGEDGRRFVLFVCPNCSGFLYWYDIDKDHVTDMQKVGIVSRPRMPILGSKIPRPGGARVRVGNGPLPPGPRLIPLDHFALLFETLGSNSRPSCPARLPRPAQTR